MYELLYNENGIYIHTQWGNFTKDQLLEIGARCLQYSYLDRYRIQKIIEEIGPDIFRWLFNEKALRTHSCSNRLFVRTPVYDEILNEIMEPEWILRKLVGE